jgi:hypothetical protein
MRQRLGMLRRIANLYGVMEEMRRSELEGAMGAVREAEEAIAVQRSAALSARLDGREALAAGDRLGWMAADKRRELAGWKSVRLEEVRVEREAASQVARQQYLASRIESEQMKRVRDGVARTVETDESRRMQAIVDDRFLSRRRWMDAQADTTMRES